MVLAVVLALALLPLDLALLVVLAILLSLLFKISEVNLSLTRETKDLPCLILLLEKEETNMLIYACQKLLNQAVFF